VKQLKTISISQEVDIHQMMLFKYA